MCFIQVISSLGVGGINWLIKVKYTHVINC